MELNLPPVVFCVEAVLLLLIVVVETSNMKKSPQKTDIVEVTNDISSRLLRTTVIKGFFFKLTSKNPMRIINTMSA